MSQSTAEAERIAGIMAAITSYQTSQQQQQHGFVFPPAPATYVPSRPLPTPSITGSVDMIKLGQSGNGGSNNAIKVGQSGNVGSNNLIQAIAAANANSSTASRDPRLAYKESRARSRSRSPVRQENYRDNFNPYKDQRRETQRRTSNGRERSASPPRAAFAPTSTYGRDRTPPPGRSGDASTTDVIQIDSTSVGLVIGKNGDNLKRVEQESGARVQFVSGPDTNLPQRPCKVSGTSRQRREAIREIFRIIAENPRSAPTRQSQIPFATQMLPPLAIAPPPAAHAAERTMQVMVPNKTVGLIIGRGGETIRDLQTKSGCHVNIVGPDKTIDDMRPVNLLGDPPAMAIARRMIEEIVSSDTRIEPGAAMPVSTGFQHYDQYATTFGVGIAPKVTQSILIASEAVGMVIGKGGETIKEMQNSSGCKINVSQPSGLDIQRSIELIGTTSAIEEATRLILEKVNTVRNKEGGRLKADAFDPPPDATPSYQAPFYGAPAQALIQPQPHLPAESAVAAPVPHDQAADPWAPYGGYEGWYNTVMAAYSTAPPGFFPPAGSGY